MLEQQTIWVKNLSAIPHNIVKIDGEWEEYPNSFRISIVDSKYRLPIALNPNDPEKIIVFVGQFLNRPPNSSSKCNIIVKVFSRWKGNEVEAGRLKFTLL